MCGVAAEKLRWGCQSNSLCEYCTYEPEVGRAANLSTHSPQRSRGRNPVGRSSPPPFELGPDHVCMATVAWTAVCATGLSRGRLPSPTGLSGISPCASQLQDPRALTHKRIDVEPRLCLCAKYPCRRVWRLARGCGTGGLRLGGPGISFRDWIGGRPPGGGRGGGPMNLRGSKLARPRRELRHVTRRSQSRPAVRWR